MERKHIFRWGALGVIGMKIQVFLISLNYDIFRMRPVSCL